MFKNNSLKNLGPQSQKWLNDMGITTHEQLCAYDPYRVFLKLKTTHPNVSLNLLYALIGAIEGLDWRQVHRERRADVWLTLAAIEDEVKRDSSQNSAFTKHLLSKQ